MTFASIKSWPSLERPALVLGLEGWVDAGYAAATAINALLESARHEVVATFDSDALLDQRSRRPVLRVSHGVHGGLTWPELRLLSATDTGGRSLLVLAGPEPDLRWHEWSQEVVALGLRLGVELVVGLGAFPAPAPHTRPVRLAATASNEELAGRVGFLPATMEVPAGAQAVLEVAFGEAGVPSIGVWAASLTMPLVPLTPRPPRRCSTSWPTSQGSASTPKRCVRRAAKPGTRSRR